MEIIPFCACRGARPAFLVAIVLIAMIVGCGKKGPVRPKLATLPAAPENVTLRQQGNLFVLGWAIPTENQDGSHIEDLSGFRIKRLTYAAEDGCPTCREPQLEVAEIDLRYLGNTQQVGNRFYWRDLDIRPGNGYRYAILPLMVGGQEGPGATVHLAVMQPPPTPTNLQVAAGDKQVALEWQRPALPQGMQLVGYNLYRRQAKRSFSIIPVNTQPLQTNTLLDRGLDNGRAYEYRVSTLVRVGEQLLESTASKPALITPQKER
jgi:hypothetical protein